MEGFPFQTIDPIVGAPTYETISDIHLKLNSNTASVHSNLEKDALGLLCLIISPAVNATLSAIPFDVLANPGSAPVIPPGSTVAQITDLCYTRASEETVFNKYDRTDKVLLQQLIGTIDKKFPFLATQVHQIRQYLYSEHFGSPVANISPSDLQDNDVRLHIIYDANHPIKNLTDQVENAVEYAAASQTLYTPAQFFAIAYQLVFQSGLFLGDLKTWRRKDPADKTWTNINIFFANSHQEWR